MRNTKITYKGKKYSSLPHLCDQIGKRLDVVEKCLRLGASLSEALTVPNDATLRQVKEIIRYDDKVFFNKKMLQSYYGISGWEVEYRGKQHNMTFIEAINDIRFPSKRVVHMDDYVVFGKHYPNIKAVAKDYGIKYAILSYRVRESGLSIEEAIEKIQCGESKVNRGFDFNGVHYRSEADAQRKLGLSHYEIQAVLQGHAYVDSSGKVVDSRKLAKQVTIDGITYESISKAAKVLGIGAHTLRRCIKHGIYDSATILDKRRRLGKIKSSGFLYKITNSITKRVYIGITLVTAQYRFKRHMKRAKNDPSSTMYEDYHKYGEESFKLRVLKRGSGEDLKKWEVEYINRRYKCRYPNGYNIAKGGTLTDSDLLKDTSVTYKGITYKSVRHLQKSLGLPEKMFNKLLKEGRPLYVCVRKSLEWGSIPLSERRVLINKSRIKHYAYVRGLGKVSLVDACKHYGLSYAAVLTRMIDSKISSREALNYYLQK